MACAQGTTVVLPLPATRGGGEEDGHWPVVCVGEKEEREGWLGDGGRDRERIKRAR